MCNMVVEIIKFLSVLIFTLDNVSGVTGIQQLSITPLDPDVCTGQNLTLTCSTLVQPTPNASIGFETFMSRKWSPVNESDILAVNDTMSKYTFGFSSKKDFQFFRCFHGNDRSSRPSSCITSVAVYTRPEKITEFNCIVHNYLESMMCSWNYGIRYNAMPKVTFQWKDQRLTDWRECAHLNVADGSCIWRSITDGDFTMKKLSISITVSQKCGMSTTSNFHVDTSKLVKPNPVDDLSATVLNSTCIRLSWKTINSRREYPKTHYVRWSSKWKKNDEETFSTPADTKVAEKLLCQLIPFTTYTFSVKIEPMDGGYFSDGRTIEATTFSDKPSASPDVIDGGYMWSPRNCERGSQRTVCLLWKPIMDIDRNGVFRGYDVTFTPISSAADGNATSTETNSTQDVVGQNVLEVNGTYGCSPLLLCNTSYMVQIAARNENVLSENSSLYIPSADFGILQPEFFVEVGNVTNGIGDVYVSWSHPKESQPLNFTVFWCRKQMGHCKDSGIINWQTFDSNNTEAILQIAAPDDYVYGVSMSSKNGCSGFKWHSCLYTKFNGPKTEPENVNVFPGHEGNTLLVTWDKLQCELGGPIISMYVVQYCSKHDCEEKTVPASGPAYAVLNGLYGNRTYAVTVRGVSRDGLEGPKSQMSKEVAFK